MDLYALGIVLSRRVGIKVVGCTYGSILTSNQEYEHLHCLAEASNGDAPQIPMVKLKSMIEGLYLGRALGKAQNPIC